MSSQTLIVPVEVHAFCVGDSDKTNVMTFAGVGLDFSALGPATDPHGAAIVSDQNGVLRPASEDGPKTALEAGVHIHWSLPRALTHGRMIQDGDDAGDILFQAAPNRWLVTRFACTAGGLQHSKSWVVESDHIADADRPPERFSVTIFTGYDHGGAPFRYLGRSVGGDGWTEPEAGTSSIKTLMNQELTAVQTGDPLFASFYPNCRNVFGFYDDLSDAPDALNGVPLLYVVAGWYSKPENDPLHAGLTAQALADQLRWSVPDGTQDTFTSSLYTGTVQAVTWNQAGGHVPATQPALSVDVAFGNNGAEAMAALISSEVNDPEHRDLLETLLTAYQMGIVSELHEPNPDRKQQMDDRLHAAGFRHIEDGIRWTVVVGDDPDAAVHLPDLPPTLAERLAELNDAQAARDAHVRLIDSARRQLFLDWYRYGLKKIVVDDNHDPDAEPVCQEIQDYTATSGDLLLDADNDPNDANDAILLKQLVPLEQKLTGAKAAAQAAAAPSGWALKALAAPWYWRPNDPVVVMTGADAEHRLHGSDPEALVPCRPADRVISSLSVRQKSFSAPASQAGKQPPPGTPVPAAIWDEALLLDASWLSQAAAADAKEVAQKLKDFLAEGKDNDVITHHEGIPPIADAVQPWDKNPWLPLFMQWSADYFGAPDARYDGKLGSFSSDYVTSHFQTDESGRLVPNGWSPSGPHWPLGGQAILTPFAAQRLINALSGHADEDLSDDIKKAKDYLSTTAFLYQGLSGFTDALLMLRQIPQIADGYAAGTDHQTYGDGGLFHDVSRNVGGAQRLGCVDPDLYFIPVRGGFLNVRLKVVGAFGQKRDASYGQLRCAASMRSGESEASKQVYLPPRFAQPSRLTFRFISAADDKVEASLLSSPLCGWLLPNHLEASLVVYDQGGVPRGALNLLNNAIKWMAAPGSSYGEDLGACMAGANGHQADLIRALAGCDAGRFRTLLQALERASLSVTGSIRPDPSLALLIGSPIALVQAEVKLSLYSRAAINQRWDAFDADMKNDDQNDPQTYVDKRTNNGVGQVKIQVEVGLEGRMRDGVLGFFVGDSSGHYDFSRFYSPTSDSATHDVVLPPWISLAPDDPGVRLLLLVDPRAQIHLSSDVLPTEALAIPPDLTMPFLDNLSVTFPARPVLATNAGYDLPLPVEPQYDWSWIQHDGSQWQTTPLAPNPSPNAAPFVPQRIYSGWLKLTRRAQQS